jgi:toxin ParE1/3/4
MGRITVSAAASRDIHEIWDYIAEESPTAADRVMRRIEKTFDAMAAYPEIGRARPELGDGLRGLIVGSHIIFYRSKDADVEIVRVLHSARDIDQATQRS